MMMTTRRHALLIWSTREILRHPGRNLLQFACLASLVFLLATALLFSQALEATWSRQMQHAPNLIIRRIDAGGWAPMPADLAVSLVKEVPGVLDPTPRLWGVVQGVRYPLTVVASAGVMPTSAIQGVTAPSPGQAVVGRLAAEGLTEGRLHLESGNRSTLVLHVIDHFPVDSDLATHDLVWISPVDARRLLGLAPDQASDLAVYLFHDEEEQAIQADLAAALPWPVRITGRSDSLRHHNMRAARAGGMAAVACIPAILALLLILTGTATGDIGRQGQWGLLKALGWTTGDIVRLQVSAAAVVGLPAVVAGLAAAHVVVFLPAGANLAALWIMDGQTVPRLALDTSGAVLTMLEISALVGLPYLATVCLTTLKGAADDPWHLIQAAPWN